MCYEGGFECELCSVWCLFCYSATCSCCETMFCSECVTIECAGCKKKTTTSVLFVSPVYPLPAVRHALISIFVRTASMIISRIATHPAPRSVSSTAKCIVLRRTRRKRLHCEKVFLLNKTHRVARSGSSAAKRIVLRRTRR